jgi:hypothetical protein
LICLLLGSTTPLARAQLAGRYANADAYTAEYVASADAAIAAGFVLPADRDALLAFSDPARVAS